MTQVFADTYALLAHFDGTKAYTGLLVDGAFATTALNVTEVAYRLLQRGQAQDLGRVLPVLQRHVVEPNQSVIEAAARFKWARRQSGANCSYVDAWGYATAQHLGIPFLTGDEDFRGVPGVKFVKG